jgi:5S rRNA maturation endonuclease (ribonuclease M5)
VLPAFGPGEDLTYVQTRYLAPGLGPKYGNPVSRLGTNPRLSWTRTPASRRSDLLVVCEGIIDALTTATAGLQAVAVLGVTYLSSGVADAIARHADDREVVVAFDGDDPGRIAAQRLHDLLVARNVEVRVCDLPEGTDLNALARSDPAWVAHLTDPQVVRA